MKTCEIWKSIIEFRIALLCCINQSINRVMEPWCPSVHRARLPSSNCLCSSRRPIRVLHQGATAGAEKLMPHWNECRRPGRAVRWTCSGKCGGDWGEYQRTPCRRTANQRASRGRLLLCQNQRRMKQIWLPSCPCGKLRTCRSRTNSRTTRCVQSSSRHPAPSFRFPCTWLQCWPILPSPLPSSSVLSTLPYTAPASSGWIALDGQGKAASQMISSPCCCPQTERDDCLRCLGPMWACRQLFEEAK